MGQDYEEIQIEVDAAEWDEACDSSTTSMDLGPDSWITQLLSANSRVYRVNLCVVRSASKIIAHAKQDLLGLGFSILRFDSEDQVSCFLTTIVRSPDQIQKVLSHLQGMMLDVLDPKDLNITYADVTFLSEGWTTYP